MTSEFNYCLPHPEIMLEVKAVHFHSLSIESGTSPSAYQDWYNAMASWLTIVLDKGRLVKISMMRGTKTQTSLPPRQNAQAETDVRSARCLSSPISPKQGGWLTLIQLLFAQSHSTSEEGDRVWTECQFKFHSHLFNTKNTINAGRNCEDWTFQTRWEHSSQFTDFTNQTE